jgi:phosphoribosyl 1,2-cyclic phosphodiesterase
VRLLFAGVRGSTPVSGAPYTRIGGHTSCVAVLRGDERTAALVLDAGTGIMELTPRFGDSPFRGSILLTHLHWDHLQGLPFFRPADRADARVTVAMPAQGDPVAVVRRALSPPHFPIGPEGLDGSWRFVGLDEGTHDIEGFEVMAREIPHKGGRTFGYRVTDGMRTFAYLPDHGPRGPDAQAVGTAGARELAAGADVLVHGAPFVAGEQQVADLYGHATVDDAIALAKSSGAPHLILTHHGPMRSDDAVDAIAREAACAFDGRVHAACDGDLFDV